MSPDTDYIYKCRGETDSAALSHISVPLFFLSFFLQWCIFNDEGLLVYLAIERKPRSVLYDILGHMRPFEIVLQNRQGDEVIRFSRPFRCQGWLFPCFKQDMKVRMTHGLTHRLIVLIF